MSNIAFSASKTSLQTSRNLASGRLFSCGDVGEEKTQAIVNRSKAFTTTSHRIQLSIDLELGETCALLLDTSEQLYVQAGLSALVSQSGSPFEPLVLTSDELEVSLGHSRFNRDESNSLQRVVELEDRLTKARDAIATILVLGPSHVDLFA
eukprot:m.54054 g.54054  ORF g.54054 m.54054 type:complete len:151 (+) comp6553_c0_seq4:273-725(+)